MQTLSFDVTGMTCGGCVGSVQRVLSKLDGVSHAEVTLRPGVATVVVDRDRVTAAQLELVIAGLGYRAKARTVALGERSEGNLVASADVAASPPFAVGAESTTTSAEDHDAGLQLLQGQT